MIHYCCGFMICLPNHVLFIRKNRPLFQVGKWNGVGGKLEAGETPLQAQVREFWEETGVHTAPHDWELTVRLHAPQHVVYYYRTFVAHMPAFEQTTDEFVAVHQIDQLYQTPTLDNMRWILPLQLSLNVRFPLDVTWQHLN